jgi:hypothetical protein
MISLVPKLRLLASRKPAVPWPIELGEDIGAWGTTISEIAREAADRIEFLQRDNDELKAAIDALRRGGSGVEKPTGR